LIQKKLSSDLYTLEYHQLIEYNASGLKNVENAGNNSSQVNEATQVQMKQTRNQAENVSCKATAQVT